jgi:alpha-beta hydrolase superfamily lysophospholipase
MALTTKMWAVLLVLACSAAAATADVRQTRDSITMRGRPQVLHLYGVRGNAPVIVSSGDGGWLHLGPHVAESLASSGHFVVGFDVKAYLESFTGAATLRPAEVANDYRMLVDFAASGAAAKPILVGVSEGAGLSVLAAADPQLKSTIAGVIALGLPERNELAWRWTDSIIYLTHRPPHEPTFSASAIVDRIAPVPLAAIHSTHDEFVSVDQVRQILTRAAEPKRLWVIEAANHRFSDNLGEFDRRLFDAVDWITTHSPR